MDGHDEHTDDLAEDTAERAPQVPAGSRRRLLWLIVAAVLVFGAGAGTAIFLLRDDEDTSARPWVPPKVESTHDVDNQYDADDDEYNSETGIQKRCLDNGGKQTVIAYFDGNDPNPAMRRAAEALREDDQIAWVRTETRQEAYRRFQEIFADEPELAKLARPEAMPASVTLLPADGVYPGDVADAITDEFAEIESLAAGCEFPK